MHAIFCPTRPIMGGLVQIKSDTYAAWMGGIPNSDWTDLKISTADPQQSSQIQPMLDSSGFHEQSKGFDIKLFSFQCKLLWHFQAMGMDTITYLNGLGSHQDGESPHGSYLVHPSLCEDCH